MKPASASQAAALPIGIHAKLRNPESVLLEIRRSGSLGMDKWLSDTRNNRVGRRSPRAFYINCYVNVERLGPKCRWRGASASNPLHY